MAIHTLAVLYHPVDDQEAFAEYYRSVHLPLARQLPAVRGIRYSLDVTGLGAPAPYVAVFEADFDSADELSAALDSPQGQRAQSDVGNFASGGVTILRFVTAS